MAGCSGSGTFSRAVRPAAGAQTTHRLRAIVTTRSNELTTELTESTENKERDCHGCTRMDTDFGGCSDGNEFARKADARERHTKENSRINFFYSPSPHFDIRVHPCASVAILFLIILSALRGLR